MEKINKLSLPATILIASVILGWFYYQSQESKQKSIEKQQALENNRQELLLKKNECESLSGGVMKKWNNVMGVKYDEEIWKECVAIFTDLKTGEVTSFPLRLMKTAK